MKQFKTQTGNALFLILIAIALLGLLTVTMTRSSSTSNDTGSYEQNQIAASEILSYATAIETAVQSLLARGCSENEISFENSTVAGYTNANSPTDKSCHIFDVAGAGLTYIVPNENWLDNSQSAEPIFQELYFHQGACVKDIGRGGNNCHGDSIQNEEMLLIIAYVNSNICTSINKAVGKNDIPQDTDNAWAATPLKFTGTFVETFLIGDPPADTMNGYESLCFEGTTNPASGTYHFYHVLHAR